MAVTVAYKLKRSMAKMYKQGWSLADVAYEFDFSVPTVRRALADFGVTIRGPGRPHLVA